MSNPGLTYKDAGVDIEAGDELVQKIKGIAKATHRPGVLGNLGGFGALFELPWQDYQQPVLVSGTDGVGTKLKLAMQLQLHHTIGIDLVAMCANDIAVCGAEPLFFLDYYATGKLNPNAAAQVISGIGKGCELAGCALVGGETAEMPGMYQGEDYDLAGFCVGLVEKSRIIDGSHLQAGDTLIAFASSGPHSNGYSLIRKIIELNRIDLSTAFADSTLGETLLTPTKIYVKTLLALQKSLTVKGIAHITGGGITENLPRILPEDCSAQIDTQSWQAAEIFQWLQQQGNISDTEMRKTFNCGVGMIIAVNQADVDSALDIAAKHGEQAWVIGEISSNTANKVNYS